MGKLEITQRAIAMVAERKVREAMEAGAFDNLPGAGKPIADEHKPYDSMWWVRNWVRRERLGKMVAPNGRTSARLLMREVAMSSDRSASDP